MESRQNVSLDTDVHFDQESVRSTVDKIIATLSDSSTVQSSIFDILMPIPGDLEQMTEYEAKLIDEWIKNPPSFDDFQCFDFNQQNYQTDIDWDNIAETVSREVENIPEHITNQPFDKKEESLQFDLLEMKRCRQENPLCEINLNSL